MIQCELNKKAEHYLVEYKKIKEQSSTFEPKGIFHSELLMAFTVAKELGVEKIIESGRARGQSTELIARFCKEHNIEFHSIEYDKNSPDTEVAEQRLAPFKDVCTLHYGDGFEVMPKLIDEKHTLIIIDGPKGVWAQKLGLLMLKHTNVKAVMFHDTHRDAEDARPRLERYLGKHLIVSDDYEFVEKYKYLDDDCWEITNKYIGGYAPYKRPNKIMRSYAGTLSCVINKGIDPKMIELYLKDVQYSIDIKNTMLYKIALKLKIVGFINRLYKKIS